MFELDGKAIRSLLIERQMTIRELAQRADVTETTAQKVTRGNAKTNARTTGKVANALGVTADKILKKGEYNNEQ